MKLYLASVFVDDQAKALDFYTNVLGFEKKHDVPVGDHRWLTVTTSGDTGGMELLLEPDEHPAAKAYKAAIKADGIPATSFLVDAGVTLVQAPMDAGPTRMAVIDDTCGNLLQLVQIRADGTQ
jgi:predicted enzyme related to lactoylglutathione lyase